MEQTTKEMKQFLWSTEKQKNNSHSLSLSPTHAHTIIHIHYGGMLPQGHPQNEMTPTSFNQDTNYYYSS